MLTKQRQCGWDHTGRGIESDLVKLYEASEPECVKAAGSLSVHVFVCGPEDKVRCLSPEKTLTSGVLMTPQKPNIPFIFLGLEIEAGSRSLI